MKPVFQQVTVAVLALLTACGGGGGGSNSTTPSANDIAALGSATVASTTTTTLSTSLLSSIVTTQPPSTTYAPNSYESKAFDLLNHERSSCGYGYLNQNENIDLAAKNHANYINLNNIPGHYETLNLQGFTGVYPSDRLKAVNYNEVSIHNYAADSETIDFISFESTLINYGEVAVRGLLSAPYHQMAMLRGFRDVGIASVQKGTFGNGSFTVELDYATPAGSTAQLQSSNDVLTYPCNGTTGVNYQLNGEDPSPIPSRNLGANPVGHPILVTVRYGNVITITSANLIKVKDGSSVILLPPFTKVTDQNNSAYLHPNEAFILPDQPLEQMTEYQATITGTNNGKAFSRTFTFTTGTGNGD